MASKMPGGAPAKPSSKKSRNVTPTGQELKPKVPHAAENARPGTTPPIPAAGARDGTTKTNCIEIC